MAATFLIIAVAAAGVTLLRQPVDPDAIAFNEMVRPGGALTSGELALALDAREGDWRPDGPDGPVLRVAAFGEPGRALQVPAPMVRVTAGTTVRVHVRNLLERELTMYGLGAERGVANDSVAIAPGAEHEFTFTPAEPGIFYYAGRTDPVPELLARTEYDSQLNGAIIVDAADGTRIADRIFMLTQWFTLDSTTVSGLGPHPILAINGRMWPHTERLDVTQGDSLHWALINASIIPHPMHLHGFYFRVDGQGDAAAWRPLPDEERFLAVTELMLPGTTLGLTWSPDRPGNWIFHCHFAGHMASDGSLNKDRRHPVTIAAADGHDGHGVPSGPYVPEDDGAGSDLAAHAQHNMSGLVLGIRVRPRGAQPAAAEATRTVRLIMRSKPEVWGEYTGYGFVLGGSTQEADADALPIPGPTLVLRRGERVAVTLVNRTHEPAAVHWHGIELESFPDGVPGWSGWRRDVLPLIAPDDSLTVHFTPPRAGTFMYHSHFNEFQQIASGMYGAIVVLDDGDAYDTETDRILLFSEGGPVVNVIAGPFPPILLNGVEHPAPMEMTAGTTYRLRLINITAEALVHAMLVDGDEPVTWRVVARDGATLPAALAVEQPAVVMFASGTIQDVEFTPAQTGALTLRFGMPPVFPGAPPPVAVPLVVR